MNLVILQDFLKDVTHQTKKLDTDEKTKFNTVDTFKEFLDTQLNILAVEAKEQELAKKNFQICLAYKKNSNEILLIKFKPSLFHRDKVEALVVNSDKVRSFYDQEWQELEKLYILYEFYPAETSFSLINITRFVYQPILHLIRQSAAIQLVTALLGFALFFTNFLIISRVVPQLALDSLEQIIWLITAISVCSLLLSFVSARADLFMGNLLEERLELLKLSIVLSLHPSHFRNSSIERILNLGSILVGICQQLFAIFGQLISLVGLIPTMVLLFLRLPSTLIYIVLGLSLIGSIMLTITRIYTRKKSVEMSLDNADLTNFVFDIVANIRRLAFYGNMNSIFKQWRARAVSLVERGWQLDKIGLLSSESQNFTEKIVQMIAIVAITFALLYSLAKEQAGTITVATAFLIFHLTGAMSQIIPRIANMIATIFELKVDLNASKSLHEAIRQDQVNSDNQAMYKSVVSSNIPEVSSRNLVLPYGCEISSPNDGCFYFSEGVMIQITGPSGGGKSTLLRCLIGLEKPQAGEIKVFGADPYQFSIAERRRIFSYVSQHTQLIPGTLKDNLILFGDGKVQPIWECLEQVQLAKKIQELPLGLNTPISGVNSTFSTGEKQRIILAQTLLKPAEILILDEATSGLPVDYERTIFEFIRKRFKMVFIVSHREHIRELVDNTITLNSTGYVVE